MAAKLKKIFVCSKCEAQFPKWLGQCSECGAWGTIAEEVISQNEKEGLEIQAGNVTEFSQVKIEDYPRFKIGLEEVDRVLGGGIVPGSLVLLGGEPGIGKCLVGSTRIFDPITGVFLPITKWLNKPRHVLSLDETNGQLLPQMVNAFLDQGVQPVLQIKTRLGRTLCCTPTHPLFTPDGWQPVGNLQPGSRIAAPRALPYFGKNMMPEHQVKLIAYILSDGSANSQISVTSIIPEIQTDLTDIAQKFGLQLRVYLKRNSAAKQFRFVQPYDERVKARKKSVAALRGVQSHKGLSWAEWAEQAGVSYGLLNAWRRGESVPSAENLKQLAMAVHVSIKTLAPEARDQAGIQTSVARFLESVGLRFVKASAKFIPTCIFCLPREQMSLFLKTLFSCDGSVFVNKEGQAGISYSTISERLAQDVQHLLLRFGFVTRLRTKLSRVNSRLYTAYEIQLLGVAEVKRFLTEIGIWGREKAKAQIMKIPTPKLSSTQFDTIPTGIKFWKHLRGTTGGLSFKRVSANVGVTLHYHRDNRPLARSTVIALANSYHTPYLQMMAQGEIYWDEIKSIIPAGQEHVYDLSVPEYANFIANDLIVHNSTLVLQIAEKIQNPVLYVSGEESAGQIKLRIDRLKISEKNIQFLGETEINTICATIEKYKPGLSIIDSIQTMFDSNISSSQGTVNQVRVCTGKLLNTAKRIGTSIFIIGHITKEGFVAGPKTLEHLVDTVLYLEGDPYHHFRILRAAKNRFGPTNEVGVFEMSEKGLKEVKNPSEIFLSQKEGEVSGSVISVVLKGTRPFLVEVQALVAKTFYGYSQRRAIGIDFNRLQLLIAVLSLRCNLPLSNFDVHLNLVGGMEVEEPAIDLPVCLSIVSALKNKVIDSKIAVFGEVGLGGEIRPVSFTRERVREAVKLGFKKIILPVLREKVNVPGIELIEVSNLNQAIKEVLF